MIYMYIIYMDVLYMYVLSIVGASNILMGVTAHGESSKSKSMLVPLAIITVIEHKLSQLVDLFIYLEHIYRLYCCEDVHKTSGIETRFHIREDCSNRGM